MTRLWAGWSWVRIPAGTRDLSLLQSIQTGSGSHPVSYWMGTGVLSVGWSGWCTKMTAHLHLVPTIRMIGAVPIIPVCTFTAWIGMLPLPLPYLVLSGQHIIQIKIILIDWLCESMCRKKNWKQTMYLLKLNDKKFPSYWKVHTYIRTYNAHYITWQWQDPAKGCQQSSDQHCCIIDWSGFLFGSSLLFWYFTVSDLSFRNIIAAPTMTWYLNTVDSPFA